MATLHNRINKRVLKQALLSQPQNRLTLSFYCYHYIPDPGTFRNQLYLTFSNLDVLGRIYVAKEGINAQISVPQDNLDKFRDALYSIHFLNGIRLNIAIEDDGKSFFALKIQVKKKIVADGLNDETFDVTNAGKHLSAAEFNELTSKPDTLVIYCALAISFISHILCTCKNLKPAVQPVVKCEVTIYSFKNIFMFFIVISISPVKLPVKELECKIEIITEFNRH